MEAVSTSEMSVGFYETRRCNIPEDSHHHTHRHENLKSHGTKFTVSFLSQICLPSIVYALTIKILSKEDSYLITQLCSVFHSNCSLKVWRWNLTEFRRSDDPFRLHMVLHLFGTRSQSDCSLPLHEWFQLAIPNTGKQFPGVVFSKSSGEEKLWRQSGRDLVISPRPFLHNLDR
jgi:hypothetical protein